MELPRPYGEDDGDEPESGGALLHHAESAAPEKKPSDQRDRHGPPSERDARGQLERHGHAANLGGEDEEADEEGDEEGRHEEPHTEALPQQIHVGAPAHRRETAGHLHQHRQRRDAEHHRPRKLIAELRPTLSGCSDRADLEESADARDDTERHFPPFFHGWPVSSSR